MAQIIDIAERRKPRVVDREGAASSRPPWALDPAACFDQFVLPMASYWQSWFASWGSLCLAPWGLQVMPVVPPKHSTPQNRAGPDR